MRRIPTIALAAALALCGCSATAREIPKREPPNTETLTVGRASIELPTDWDTLDPSDPLGDGSLTYDDAGCEGVIVYPPYGGSASLTFYPDGEDADKVRESYDRLAYEFERDGDEVLRREIAGGGDEMRASIVRIGDVGGEAEELWDTSIVSDGALAWFSGGVPTSCTEEQRAEFAWVADSLRLDG